MGGDSRSDPGVGPFRDGLGRPRLAPAGGSHPEGIPSVQPGRTAPRYRPNPNGGKTYRRRGQENADPGPGPVGCPSRRGGLGLGTGRDAMTGRRGSVGGSTPVPPSGERADSPPRAGGVRSPSCPRVGSAKGRRASGPSGGFRWCGWRRSPRSSGRIPFCGRDRT